MTTTVMLGDTVEVESAPHEGARGQVWTEPADGVVVVATGAEFLRIRDTQLRVLEHALPRPRVQPVNQTAKLVKARKVHQCGCERVHDTGHRCAGIKAGQQYVRSVLFPGDINSSGQPWVMRLCLVCAAQYDSTNAAALAVSS